jgi:hypothetical protein
MLNGAMGVVASAEPVSLLSVTEAKPDGSVALITHAEAHIRLGRMKARGGGVAVDVDGHEIPPPPPVATTAQRWATTAASNAKVADLLRHVGKSDDWYELYKAIECASILAGGWHALVKLMQSDGQRLNNLKQTANFHRHFNAPKPASRMSNHDGRALLAAVVRQVLSES